MSRTQDPKRQTRLAFTPLPSSSPQAAGYPSQVQERAAGIKFEDVESPSKKRRTAAETPWSKPLHPSSREPESAGPERPVSKSKKSTGVQPMKAEGALPTPVASSQTEIPAVPDESDSGNSLLYAGSPVQAQTPRGGTTNPFRRRLNSSPFVLPHTPTKQTTQRSQTTPASGSGKKGVSNFFRRRGTTENRKKLADESEDFEDDDIPAFSQYGRRGKQKVVVVSSGEGSEDGLAGGESPPKRCLRSANKNKCESSSTRAKAGKSDMKKSVASPKRTRGEAKASIQAPQQSHREIQRSTCVRPMVKVDWSSDEESTLPDHSKAVKSTSSLDQSESEDDILPLTASRKVQKSAKTVDLDEGDEESDDPLISPTKRRRLVRPAQSPTQSSTYPRRQSLHDLQDLQEDLEILQDTEVRKSRTRGKAAPSKRDLAKKQLDILKARRAGQKDGILSNPVERELPTEKANDSESTLEVGVPSEISDFEEDERIEAFRQSLGSNDEYDEDFVVDDDEDALGAPDGRQEIPLEFTMHAYKKIKDLFKDAVEWMVHNKINPAFPRNDPVYRNAFYRLDGEVKGYSGSRFISSSWTGDFARALKARPNLHEIGVPTMFDKKCDACNRSGHPAKFKITFDGKAYDPESLEDLKDDDDDEEGIDARSLDENGQSLPSTEMEFFVGRFCRANATTAHSLLHWRYNLNQWVLDFLEGEGYTSPERIVEREKWSSKKRSDYANSLVDKMEQAGDIRGLYRDFKNVLDQARNQKASGHIFSQSMIVADGFDRSPKGFETTKSFGPHEERCHLDC